MDKEQYLLELGLILEPERKIISDTILKEKLPVRMNLHNYGMFSIDYFMDDHFMIELEFDTKMEARVSFYQSFEDSHGYQSRIQIMPIKKHVPQNVLKLGHYRDGSYLLNLDNSISETFISAIKLLISENESLIKMCQASSCYDRNGKLKKMFKSWKTEATLLFISKETPWKHVTTGISKSQQPSYDALPGVHGSNGTYAENINPYWALTFRVRRLAFEVDQSITRTIDIHDYITKELMPRLEWERVTADRLEQLNKCIKGKKITVITSDMEEAPLFRSFYPVGSNDCWNEYLNECFKEL